MLTCLTDDDILWHSVTQCVWQMISCDRWLWQMISDKSWRATAQISSGGIARLWWQWLYNTVSAPALHQHKIALIEDWTLGFWNQRCNLFVRNEAHQKCFWFPLNLQQKRREALFKGTVSWWNMTRQVCLLYRANNVLTMMSLDAVDENDNVFFSSASQWAFYQDPADTPSAQ